MLTLEQSHERKTRRITLTDIHTGKRHTWKAYRDGQYWLLEDHDGTLRTCEKNWIDSIPKIELTARNYDFSILTPLSAWVR